LNLIIIVINTSERRELKKKKKLINNEKLTEIKSIGKKMEDSISEYFYKSNIPDPTANFDWGS
jgi:hypothetical protein